MEASVPRILILLLQEHAGWALSESEGCAAATGKRESYMAGLCDPHQLVLTAPAL